MSTPTSLTQTILAALFAAVTLPLGGCVSAPAKPPLPAAALGAPLGRVAVVAFANARDIQVQVPDSRTDIAQEKRSFEVISPMDFRSVAPTFLIAGPEVAAGFAGFVLGAPVVLMAAEPIAQEVRRGYGLLVADSAPAISTARGAIEHAVRGVRFEDDLRARVTSTLALQPARFSLANTEAFRPGWSYGDLNYASLRAKADTVLEIKVFEPGLSGGDGINPALALNVHVRVRLLDLADGRVLYYDYLEYCGATRKFVEWGAHDAALLRAELSNCVERLSAEIVAQLFTRPRGERADAAALAAMGIRHRKSAG